MIKNLKPNKNGHFQQGYINLNECKKNCGKTPVIYRSSWERKFVIYCEQNSQIESWSSESVEIPYFDGDTKHRYYPDFLIKMKNGLYLLCEVKPLAKVSPPIEPKRKTTKSLDNYNNAKNTYRIDMLKFAAAKKYCDDRSWVFRIITESFFEKNK